MHVPSKLLTTTTTTFLSFEPKCFKTTNPVTASALHHNSTAYVIESDDDAMVWSYNSQVSNVEQWKRVHLHIFYHGMSLCRCGGGHSVTSDPLIGI